MAGDATQPAGREYDAPHPVFIYNIGFLCFFGADNGGGCDENMWIADRIAIVEWWMARMGVKARHRCNKTLQKI